MSLPADPEYTITPALKPREMVNHPNHYGGDTTYEAIKVIEAWELGFHLGNTVKYISRAGKKDPAVEIQDLEKAQWYLERRIAQLKGDRCQMRKGGLEQCALKPNHGALHKTSGGVTWGQ